MPVSHELKCIFVHIPKTGGTSVESALGILGDWRVENISAMFGLVQSNELKKKIGVTKFLQHLTAEELRQLLPNEFQLYYRFAFVRNPWDRMVSVYCSKDPDLLMHAQLNGIELANTSFSEFLDRTENLMHIHLLPQHEFIFDRNGERLVHFIGRFERLLQDFDAICQRLNISRALPHKRPSIRHEYRKYYDADSNKKVERRYKKDIEVFAYSF